MDVRLDDYVDRYLINYIVYHPKNFTSRGDTALAYSTFENQYRAARGEMKLQSVEQQAEAINNTLALSGRDAIKSVALVNALANGQLLERTLDSIADALNATIDQVSVRNMDDIVNSAYSYADIFTNGYGDKAKVEGFFNAVLQGLSMTYGYDNDILNRLVEVGVQLTGDSSFSLSNVWQGQTFTMSLEAIKNAERVITYLQNAADKLKDNGNLSAESFRGTIRNIFQSTIAEKLAAALLGSALTQGLDQFEQELQARNTNVTINSRPNIRQGGRDREGKKTSKVDIFNSKGFSMQVSINGSTATIEVGTNMSVKWYKGGAHNNDIHIVSKTPFRQMYGFGTPEGYLASNVIVHGHDETKADSGIGASYRMLRGAIAASFFNTWLSGSGKTIGGAVDKAQFLMVNGKVYSIMTIVNNICDALIAQNNEFQKVLTLSISGIDNIRNDWQGGYDETHAPPSVAWARLRSELVNQALNNITISASFNSKYLT